MVLHIGQLFFRPGRHHTCILIFYCRHVSLIVQLQDRRFSPCKDSFQDSSFCRLIPCEACISASGLRRRCYLLAHLPGQRIYIVRCLCVAATHLFFIMFHFICNRFCKINIKHYRTVIYNLFPLCVFRKPVITLPVIRQAFFVFFQLILQSDPKNLGFLALCTIFHKGYIGLCIFSFSIREIYIYDKRQITYLIKPRPLSRKSILILTIVSGNCIFFIFCVNGKYIICIINLCRV